MKILNLNLFDALSLFEVKSSSHKKNISCCLKDHNLNKNFWKNKIYVKLIFQLQIRLNPRHSNFRSPCSLLLLMYHRKSILCYFCQETTFVFYGMPLCCSNPWELNFKSLMPPNLFGPGDNYDLNNSHFFPALLKKIYLENNNIVN